MLIYLCMSGKSGTFVKPKREGVWRCTAQKEGEDPKTLPAAVQA